MFKQIFAFKGIGGEDPVHFTEGLFRSFTEFCRSNRSTNISVHLVNIKPEMTAVARDTVKKCMATTPYC